MVFILIFLFDLVISGELCCFVLKEIFQLHTKVPREPVRISYRNIRPKYMGRNNYVNMSKLHEQFLYSAIRKKIKIRNSIFIYCSILLSTAQAHYQELRIFSTITNTYKHPHINSEHLSSFNHTNVNMQDEENLFLNLLVLRTNMKTVQSIPRRVPAST